ncbi:MAG: amidohydrolase family protein [Planctomycetes bacterium]|nr:amidohydrolase family protein [Planctomycetota bacterium]
MRLDAHQHFWQYTAAEYGWIDSRMLRIARDFLPDDLGPELARAGIDGCIAVQARSSLDETRFLLDLARRHPIVRGVVGWADLTAPDAADVVARLAQDPRLCGLRHIVQAEPDDFLLRADFQRGVRSLAAHGLVYDILVFPRQLAAAERFVQALPGQPFVLDHLAKPDVLRGERTAWERGFRGLARLPNVSCKLSGMVTEAAWNGWRPDDFTFYLDTALAAFGEDRIVFGSDWPVCLVAARDYAAVHDLLAGWAQKLAPAAQAKLFGGNAARIYGIA